MKAIAHFSIMFAVAYGVVYGAGKLLLWVLGELK